MIVLCRRRESGEDFSARLNAPKRSRRLTVLKENQCGNGGDAKASGQFGRLADVDLGDDGLPGLSRRDFFQNGIEHPARTTAFRPEVHEDWRAIAIEG